MYFYKSFLKDLQEFAYPNISVLTDEQIADIFNKENRRFLLKWIFQQMGNEICTAVNETNDLENLLVDLLFEMGYCKNCNKVKFVRDDVTLEINEQILVFKKLFNHLKELQLKKIDGGKNKCGTNFEEGTEFVKTDRNIFPQLGPIKLRMDHDRKQNLTRPNTNYSSLDKNNRILTNTELCENINMDVINKSLGKVCDLIPTNYNVLENLSRKNEKTDTRLLQPLETNNVINLCHKYISIILQHIQSAGIISSAEYIKYIEEFTKDDDKNEIFNMLIYISRDIINFGSK